jgi:hypothetical protein
LLADQALGREFGGCRFEDLEGARDAGVASAAKDSAKASFTEEIFDRVLTDARSTFEPAFAFAFAFPFPFHARSYSFAARISACKEGFLEAPKNEGSHFSLGEGPLYSPRDPEPRAFNASFCCVFIKQREPKLEPHCCGGRVWPATRVCSDASAWPLPQTNHLGNRASA